VSDLHEIHEAVMRPDVPLQLLRRRAQLRALPSPIESTVRIGNLVVAAERGWVPPEAA
jgi:hypothetical protein